jgi:hypothetical protein
MNLTTGGLMKDLTIGDNTQVHLLQHLEITEQLLAKAASFVSGSEQSAQIYLMPDLGLPLNISRIHGGFYTGALYTWTSKIPFVPIDTTVNSCGVSVFRIKTEIKSREEFIQKIELAINKTKDTSYKWNFANGNHFINYCETEGSDDIRPGKYIVLHSSASEFKNQYNGLYPTQGNWYSDKIKVIRSNSRHIRYIEGKTAEQFISVAKMLAKFNQIRHRFFADLIINGSNIEEEIVNVQHYGMPSDNSVAIGCQWFCTPDVYLLLTAPERPMYFIRVKKGGKNTVTLDGQEFLLSPHGLGVRSSNEIKIKYNENTMIINNKEYSLVERLAWGAPVEVRSFDNTKQTPELVNKVLEKCPGDIIGSLNPVYTYDRRNLNNSET